MWRKLCQRQTPPECFIGRSWFHACQAIILRNGKTSDFGRVSWGASCRVGFSSNCAECRTTHLMLPLWPRWCPLKDGTKSQSHSKVVLIGIHYITCLHPVLSVLSRNSRTPEGEENVWHNATTISFTGNGKQWYTLDPERSCIQSGSQAPHKRNLQLLGAVRPLGLVPIHILIPLQRTTTENQHIAVITSLISKLILPIPNLRWTRQRWVDILEQLCSAMLYTLICIDWQLAPACEQNFTTICLFILVKLLTKSGYHPQTAGKIERYNCTITAKLRR